jgi:hypothetical protein
LRPIAVAEERRLSPTGLARYPDDYAIKQVEVAINYVDFDDKTAISPDAQRDGEKRITEVPEGVTKYKAWLRDEYRKIYKKRNFWKNVDLTPAACYKQTAVA